MIRIVEIKVRKIKTALVIPVHNRRETTLRALRSLARIRLRESDFRIIVVDDGSTDGTSEAIKENFPQVQLIAGDGTLHYAAGTNRGIEMALDWDPDYIVTMNDDSVFHEDFLQCLIDTAKANPRSVIGSLLLLWDQPHKVFQVGQKWNTLLGGWVFPADLTTFTVPEEPFQVECIVGNCVLFPAKAIRENGLLDEKRFPYGWGDAQYLIRLRNAGWRLFIDPKSLVWCEPNTNPVPLHRLSFGKKVRILFADNRHPLNLKRQFLARWEGAPSRILALVAFGAYLSQLALKALRINSSSIPRQGV